MKNFYEIFKWTGNQRVLFWVFLGILIFPNLVMLYTESTTWLTKITSVVLMFGLYWLSFAMWKKPGNAFWWLFIFFFFGAFEIVLLFLFGESPIAVDMFLNVTTTNISEVHELLSDLIPAVAFVFFLYIPAMILAVVSIKNKKELTPGFLKKQRILSIPVILVGIGMLVSNYYVSPYFKIRNDIFPLNVCYNLGLSIKRVYKTSNYEKTSAHFTYNAKSNRTDSINEIYVLMIGETLRADNLSVYGYERNTTPNLAQMDSSTVVFRDAFTMSNTTHKSVPMLLSPIASEAFDSIYYRKGIITAFKEAGFSTAFYSNQRRNHSFIDFFGCEADDVLFLKDSVSVTANINDFQLVNLFKKRIESYTGGKLLIVLHCYGSHFNYQDRYLTNRAVFKPDYIPSADKKYRDRLINSYDNTVVQADEFFNRVATVLEQTGVNSAIVFTSDHGEDIFDDERGRFLHASPLPTYYQVRVPLIVWTSKSYRETYKDIWDNLKGNKDVPISTNKVVFHTLLDMCGVDTHFKINQNALSNKDFKESKRMYVNDHNEFLPFERAGFKKQDVEQFKLHGLKY